MKYIILSIVVIFIIGGCGSNVMFKGSNPEGPQWAENLSYRIDSLGMDNAQKIGAKNRYKLSMVSRKTVNDVVTPLPENQKNSNKIPHNVKKPQWVSRLEQQVAVYTIHPKSRQNTVIGQDLIYNPLIQQKAVYPPFKRAVKARKVDIIFNVDNSVRMQTFLKQVPNTFSNFIPTLSGMDWKMMFTINKKNDTENQEKQEFSHSAGESIYLEYDGKILNKQSKYLTSDVENAESIFIDTLRIHKSHEYTGFLSFGKKDVCSLPPYCDFSYGNSQVLKNLIHSFSENADYFRPDADVVAVIISDWYNEGVNIDSDNAQNMQIKAENIIQAFKQKWGDSKRLVVYGMIMDTCITEACKAAYSEDMINHSIASQQELIKVINLTGGKTYKFYSNNYTDLAQQIVTDFGGL